jgi:hypothetical protein
MGSGIRISMSCLRDHWELIREVSTSSRAGPDRDSSASVWAIHQATLEAPHLLQFMAEVVHPIKKQREAPLYGAFLTKHKSNFMT